LRTQRLTQLELPGQDFLFVAASPFSLKVRFPELPSLAEHALAADKSGRYVLAAFAMASTLKARCTLVGGSRFRELKGLFLQRCRCLYPVDQLMGGLAGGAQAVEAEIQDLCS
jgi:hypothetical protein